MQTIVVVSTSRSYVDVLTAVLTDEGYATHTCLTSHHAADVIRHEQPALVLLDLWLEHPNAGEMVLALLHHDPATRHIPIVICAERQEALSHMQSVLGEHDCGFLVKPFDIDDLLATIMAMIGSGCLVHSR